ncbi:hypothetical protein EV174_005397, partial [Coemansia sp. RSA 2320]
FVGTDISKESVSVAIQNVTLSELHDRIDVFLNTDRLTTLPLNAPGFPLPKEDADGSVFTFSMCNPPFYEDNDERQRLKQMKHGMPSLSTTAKDGELFTQGGEEAFLTGMVDESVVLAKRIKWYTTMVGKKGTIALLKAKLPDGHAPVLRFKVSIAATSTLSTNATNINMLVEPGFDCSDLMGLYNNLRRKLSELQ